MQTTLGVRTVEACCKNRDKLAKKYTYSGYYDPLTPSNAFVRYLANGSNMLSADTC